MIYLIIKNVLLNKKLSSNLIRHLRNKMKIIINRKFFINENHYLLKMTINSFTSSPIKDKKSEISLRHYLPNHPINISKKILSLSKSALYS